MNIKELKEIIKDLPDDMPVLEGPDKAVAGDCWAEVCNDRLEPSEANIFLYIGH